MYDLFSQYGVKMIFRTRKAEFEAIRREMAPKFERENVRIIEAGCGRKWEYKLPDDVTPYIIGIDIDDAAMQLRAALENDLDELHCCDSLDAKIRYATADIIYCSFVFESNNNVIKIHKYHGYKVLKKFTIIKNKKKIKCIKMILLKKKWDTNKYLNYLSDFPILKWDRQDHK